MPSTRPLESAPPAPVTPRRLLAEPRAARQRRRPLCAGAGPHRPGLYPFGMGGERRPAAAGGPSALAARRLAEADSRADRAEAFALMTERAAREERQAAEDLIEEAGATATALRRAANRVSDLRKELAAARELLGGDAPESIVPAVSEQGRDVDFPATYEEMGNWVDDRHAGRLFLSSRARRNLSNARYENVALVYRCLEALAGPFTDGKRGGRGVAATAARLASQEYADTLLALNVKDTQCGARKHVKVYEADGPDGTRLTMSRHLKHGTNREERYCMRIYYIWCTVTNQVVVGWLPSHLKTDLT